MILVTGGTGFVGQSLVRYLVSLGRPVRILLRPSSDSPRLPRGLPVDVAVCGLSDERGLSAAMKDVEVVFHLASAEHKGSKADLNGVDVEGSENLVRAAAQAGVDRFFYLSHLGADRSSAYPVFRAKALAESFIQQSGVPYTIFRSGLLFGQGDHFTRAMQRLVKSSPVFLFIPEEGSTMLQPLWVEDLVVCLGLALDDTSLINQTISIGGREYLSYRDVMDTLLGKMRKRRIFVSASPAYLRILGLFWDQIQPKKSISYYWLDYLAADRTCAVDTIPRLFGLMPARFGQIIDYLDN
jgi:NADH dehydrogenase